MAEDSLKQEMGFDASKAIQTLENLNRVTDSFEKNLGRVVQRLNAFNRMGKPTADILKNIAREGNKAATALNKLAGLPTGGVKVGAAKPGDSFTGIGTSATEAANKVSAAAAKIDSAAETHLPAAAESTRKLTVDFKTMVRIITTQAIVRALSAIRSLLQGAVSDAVQFQTSVAEIGTIAPTGDLGDLAAHVRAISDEFNTPLETTAKGYYQTISNQIGQTTEDFDKFMSAAAKFSKTSVTDLASAGNLGSGALNAYGKSLAEAEDTFAKFFVTIKQGRVIGSELAQGMGSVQPIAEKLGVEMEEVNAALAATTIQGIAADKAFTQLRGIFTSFLKPTPEMTAALKKKNYESGQQILQAYDLQTALRMVIDTTDGSAEAIGKLIPRMRGLTGGIALVNDEAEHFTKTMDAQQKNLQEIYDRGYKLVMETDAQKVTKELNKLKNYMTTEFGAAVLQTAGEMLDWVGGADEMKKILDTIGPQLPTIALGLTALGGALAIVAIKSSLATKGLSGMVGPMGIIAAIPLAAALGDYIGKSVVESWDAEQREFEKFLDKQTAARKEKVAAELAVERQKVKELEQLFAREFAKVRGHYFKIADTAVDTNKTILGDMKFFAEGVIRESQKMATAYRSAFEGMQKDVLASETRVSKLRLSLDDRVFDNRIKKQSDIHKVYALTQRASQTAAKAASQMSKALTEGDRGDATEEFKRAEAYAKQAAKIAEGTDNRALEAKVLATMESLTKKNIRAEEAYQQTVAKSQVQMAKRAKTEERRVADLKEKQKELLEAFKLYDEDSGELLSFDARSAKLKGAQKTLHEFITLASKGEPFDVGQMVDYASLSTQMSQEMSKFRIEELLASADALMGLNTQVQDSLNRARLEVPGIKMLGELTGEEVTGPVSQGAALEKLLDEYDSLFVKRSALLEAENDEVTATLRLNTALKQIGDSYRGIGVGTAQFITTIKSLFSSTDSSDLKFWKDMVPVLALLNRGSADTTITLKTLDETLAKVKGSERGQSIGASTLTGNFKRDVDEAIAAWKKLIVAREEAARVQKEQGGYDAIQSRIQEIEAAKALLEQPAIDAQAMNVSVGSAAMSMANSVANAQALAASWSSIASSAQIASMASSSIASPAMAAHGGMIRYLASGGQARGTDQIPAMLTKEEYVVNAKSSRRFFSQLSAMNAGMQPVYRESGGTVTNIGDVSISVTEAQSGKQTAREVMNAFRREQRRGSGRL